MIIREPNYEYFKKELEWYKTESLNVNDIQGGAPVIWKMCADELGYINSNYGWMIWSKDNYEQYKHCMKKLIEDCGGIKPYNPVKPPKTETKSKKKDVGKKMSKKEIMKKLENPNLSNVERNELMEKLYEGIEFKG